MSRTVRSLIDRYTANRFGVKNGRTSGLATLSEVIPAPPPGRRADRPATGSRPPGIDLGHCRPPSLVGLGPPDPRRSRAQPDLAQQGATARTRADSHTRGQLLLRRRRVTPV